MDQSLSLSGTPVPRGVRVRQTIAALLLTLPLVVTLLGLDLLSSVGFAGYTAIESAMCLIAFLLLLPAASNRIIRTALVVRCVWTLVVVVTFAGFAVVILGNEDSYSDNVLTICSVVLSIVMLLGGLVWVYFYSLILHEVPHVSTRSWIVLLAVAQMTGWVSLLSFFWMLFLPEEFASPDNLWSVSSFFRYFQYMFTVLCIIGIWKLVRSRAFSGNYNAEMAPRGAYSPFNRYMAGLVVAALATIGGLCLMASYASQIM